MEEVIKAKEELLSAINALSGWQGETEHARQFDEQLNIAKKQIIEYTDYVERGLELYLEAEELSK